MLDLLSPSRADTLNRPFLSLTLDLLVADLETWLKIDGPWAYAPCQSLTHVLTRPASVRSELKLCSGVVGRV